MKAGVTEGDYPPGTNIIFLYLPRLLLFLYKFPFHRVPDEGSAYVFRKNSVTLYRQQQIM